MNQDFCITLPSSVRSYFNSNIISSFKTKLAHKLHFPRNENWSVGLVEISYPKSWFNVVKRHKIELFNKSGDIFKIPENVVIKLDNFTEDTKEKEKYMIDDNSTCIKVGHYEDVQQLCSSINNKFEAFKSVIDKVPILKIDKISNKACLKPAEIGDDVYFPYLGEEIEYILGLADHANTPLYWKTLQNVKSSEEIDKIELIFKEKKHKAYRCVELNATTHSLFVYSDIVQHNYVGDGFAQLLRIVEVPNNSKLGDTIVLTYDQPHYIPLQTNFIDTIQLDIKDDTDQLIQFETGKVIIKLKFVKNE